MGFMGHIWCNVPLLKVEILSGLHEDPHDQLKGAKGIRDYLRCAKKRLRRSPVSVSRSPSENYLTAPDTFWV